MTKVKKSKTEKATLTKNELTTQLLEKTGLNWTVSKRALKDGQLNDAGFNGIFNDSTNECLGVFKKKYEPAQNSDLMGLIVEYFGNHTDYDLSTVQGFSTHGGAKVYISIDGNNMFKDTVAETKQKLFIRDSRDGSSSVRLGCGEYVLVCSNGMVRFKGENRVKVNHNQKLKHRLENFDRLFGDYLNLRDEMRENYERWMNEKLSSQLIAKVVQSVLKMDTTLSKADFEKQYSTRKLNQYADLKAAIDLETSNERHNKTYYGLLQGVTNYSTHNVATGDLAHIAGGGSKTINRDAYDVIDTHFRTKYKVK